jgi:hypothetical protein
MKNIRNFFLSLRDTGRFAGIRLFTIPTYSFRKSDWALYLLVSIFTLAFLPHAFLMLEDLTLITALEVDPGSMLRALHSLFGWPYYNMHNGFHSQFYGWTYFSMNFWLLWPFKLVSELLMDGNPVLFHFSVRLLLFFIGLFSLIAFYRLTQRLFKSPLLSFTGGMFLIFSTVPTQFYFFIHPETTGVLFMILSVHCLLNFIEQPDKQRHWYTLGLSCLVLASLSKQLFFITALPVLFLFPVFYARHKGIGTLQLTITKEFWTYFFFTCGLSFLLLLIIHPYAIFQPDHFIDAQLSTINDHSSSALTYTTKEAFMRWYEAIHSHVPLYNYFALLLIPASIVAFLKVRGTSRTLFLTCGFSVLIITLIVMLVSKLFAGTVTYLYPIYPFLLLYLMACVHYVVARLPNIYWRVPVLGMMAFFAIVAFIFPWEGLYNHLTLRLNYRATVTYQAYQYMAEYMPEGAKIAHDHIVALPTREKGLVSCHYWQACSTIEGIRDFDPDFLVFNPEYTHNYKVPENTQNMLDYVEEANMEEIYSVHGGVIGGPPRPVVVYKKPGVSLPE